MKNLLSVVILCVFIFSCKKKDSTTPAEAPSYTGGGTTPSNPTITNGLPANTNSVNGVFLAYKITIPSFPFTSYQGFASLNNVPKPLQTINPISILVIGQDNGGALKINNNTMKYETVNSAQLHLYSDTIANPDYSSGVTWKLGGNSSFSSFNATVTRGFPLFNNTTFLPASFSKSQPLTINFGNNNFSNKDSIFIQLSGPSIYILKTIPSNATSVNFSASELSGAIVGTQNVQISVYLKNYSSTTVNNKTHVFIMVSILGGYADITT